MLHMKKSYQENNCFQSALVWCWGGLGRDCHSSPGDCNCNNLHHCCLCRHSNDHQYPHQVTVIIVAIAFTIVFVFVNNIAMVIPVIVIFITCFIIIVIVVATCPTWSQKKVGLWNNESFYVCSWSNLFCGSGWTAYWWGGCPAGWSKRPNFSQIVLTTPFDWKIYSDFTALWHCGTVRHFLLCIQIYISNCIWLQSAVQSNPVQSYLLRGLASGTSYQVKVCHFMP